MRQTVSFTSSAENAPEVNTIAHRSARGPDTERSTSALAQAKKPAAPRYVERIIIPSRRPSVSPFTAAAASAGESTPAATMRTAPRSAAAGRSTERNGSRPAATARYVSAKIPSATATAPCSTPPPGLRDGPFVLNDPPRSH